MALFVTRQPYRRRPPRAADCPARNHLVTNPCRYAGPVTTAAASTPLLEEAVASPGALAGFLHGLPTIDQVGCEARAAALATRSIKTTAKQWAIDQAISMIDLTTLE